MEALIPMLIVGGIIYLFVKRGSPKVTDWSTPIKNESPQQSIYTTDRETVLSQSKNIFNPSETSTLLIKALIYIGKADGQLREDEVKIIADFLKTRQEEHNLSDEWYLICCIRDIKSFTPAEYNNFIAVLDKETRSDLLTWYKKIVGTQAKSHPFEEHLLQEMQGTIYQ